MKLLLLLTAMLPCAAQEVLRYSINWPSGLSLGEAQLESRSMASGKDAPSRLEYNFTLDASIPGFAVIDKYRSLASMQQCSIEFEKRTQHGAKKTVETTTFKPESGVATRQTENGGKSDIPISGCARDALAYVFWLRSELAQGRLPSTQTILFGSPYKLSVKFGASQDLTIGNKRIPADRIEATLKGPASERQFEVFFGRDPKRQLLLVRVPLAMGSFSMELTD